MDYTSGKEDILSFPNTHIYGTMLQRMDESHDDEALGVNGVAAEERLHNRNSTASLESLKRIRLPPDSGAFVTPQSLLQQVTTSVYTTPSPSPLAAYLLSPDFLCYSVYRIWHKKPGSHCFVPPSEALSWFPPFIAATRTVLSRSPSVVHLLLGLLYVARLKTALPHHTTLESGSEYKILIAALLLAHKYHSDERIPNRCWSSWSGLETKDLNAMEREFMTAISGRLFVKEREFKLWGSSIQVLVQEFAWYQKIQALESNESAMQVDQSLGKVQEEERDVLERARPLTNNSLLARKNAVRSRTARALKVPLVPSKSLPRGVLDATYSLPRAKTWTTPKYSSSNQVLPQQKHNQSSGQQSASGLCSPAPPETDEAS